MGDPKKLKKKYWTPRHPWSAVAIEQEKTLKHEYGLVKKKEIMIANSFLKKYKNIAKALIATKTVQAEKETAQVLHKLQSLGLLSADSGLDQILALQSRDILNRRLQSVLHRKGLSRTMKQARQFIVHRHVQVGSKEITSPSYLVTLEEEMVVNFKGRSPMVSEDHPERVVIKKEANETSELKEIKKKADVKTQLEEEAVELEEPQDEE
ncbi:30S ribosomal protein S4 [Candidatus Woesearchaeota archaeon CG10_big_fil_rev_8_21_14_0_10_45_16]|nr:MAG: 30S ribosomal protein S4 [Candidatus Woesearchaeota archaeon CG10_big_fil_rev_8_21_14_0_10_45_16]